MEKKETVERRAVKIAAGLMAELHKCCGRCESDAMDSMDEERCKCCLEKDILERAVTELIVEDKPTETEAMEHRAVKIVVQILASDHMPCLEAVGCSCKGWFTCADSIEHFLLDRAATELEAEEQPEETEKDEK